MKNELRRYNASEEYKRNQKIRVYDGSDWEKGKVEVCDFSVDSISPKTFLYNSGDECTDLTGGWSMTVKGRAWWTHAYIDAILNADNMELRQTPLCTPYYPNNLWNCGVRNITPIDIRGYARICILAYSNIRTALGNVMQISPSTQWDSTTSSRLPVQKGLNLLSRNISIFSSKSGHDYIRINMLTDIFDGYIFPPYAATKILKVWVE